MTRYAPGEVVIASFPFTSGRRAKTRQALVLLDTGDADVVVARMTSKPVPTPHDVAVRDWSGAGLHSPGVIRLHKISTLAKGQVFQSVGHLQPADRQAVAAALNRTFGSW